MICVHLSFSIFYFIQDILCKIIIIQGFFDPNTNKNLTYLALMTRCMTESDSGMVYLVLKEKRSKSRKSGSSSSRKKHRSTHRSRKVVIVDPDTKKELSVREAYKKGKDSVS